MTSACACVFFHSSWFIRRNSIETMYHIALLYDISICTADKHIWIYMHIDIGFLD